MRPDVLKLRKIKTAHPAERDKAAKERKGERLSLLCELWVFCAFA
jgi:hypothetical protein